MLGKQISALELNSLIVAGLPVDSAIVNVRSKEECGRGMIAGAKNIPVDELQVRTGELQSYKKVYLYCLSGGRSEMASALLTASGFKGEVYSLTSGLLAWRKSGFALPQVG